MSTAATFHMKAENSSTKDCSFVLYQKHPNEDDITELAWKVEDLAQPKPSQKPTTGSIKWALKYMVTIPIEMDGVYTVNKSPGLFFPAEEGYNHVVATSGESLVISTAGPGDPGYITFTNTTETPLDLGVALSGTLLAVKKHVPIMKAAKFKVLSNYYIGLLKSIKQGSILTPGFDLGPNLIRFTNGYNIVFVESFFQNGDNALSTPVYSTEK